MFEIIARPNKNRRSIKDDDMLWDTEVEEALLGTVDGSAIKLPLAKFHCSPAKGRLWKVGYRVKHRVLADREHVAAWIE